MADVEELEDADRWLNDDPKATPDRQRFRPSTRTTRIMRRISWTSCGVALLMIAVPLVLHAASGLGADRLSASALVNWSFGRINYIQIYVALALVGSLMAIVLALTRLLAAQRASRGALHSPADIEASTSLVLVGVTPDVPPAEVFGKLSDSRSDLREAYYLTTHSLAFQTETGVPKSILLTSSRPAEGKSTTALGLAVCLAARGNRVLLMDADLRNPTIHRMVGVENDGRGTSTALNSGDLEGTIRPVKKLGLDVMAVGSLPPDPSALLARGFERLLRKLAPNYDHILIDGPPVMGFADAPILSKGVDQTLFIVSAGQSYRIVSSALGRLAMEEGATLCVLTKFKSKLFAYGGYDYAYDYTYGPSQSRHP